MWLYYLLKTMSTVISWLPYKAVVVIGKGMGHLYYKIAKSSVCVQRKLSASA